MSKSIEFIKSREKYNSIDWNKAIIINPMDEYREHLPKMQYDLIDCFKSDNEFSVIVHSSCNTYIKVDIEYNPNANFCEGDDRDFKSNEKFALQEMLYRVLFLRYVCKYNEENNNKLLKCTNNYINETIKYIIGDAVLYENPVTGVNWAIMPTKVAERSREGSAEMEWDEFWGHVHEYDKSKFTDDFKKRINDRYCTNKQQFENKSEGAYLALSWLFKRSLENRIVLTGHGEDKKFENFNEFSSFISGIDNVSVKELFEEVVREELIKKILNDLAKGTRNSFTSYSVNMEAFGITLEIMQSKHLITGATVIRSGMENNIQIANVNNAKVTTDGLRYINN